ARKIDAQLTSTVSSLYLMAGAVTIVSIPLIATVSSLVANERRREIGLLRMMGAKKSFVFQAILMEALLLALIGAIIGTVGSSLFIVIFKDLITTNLGIPFLWPGLDTLLLQVWLVMLAAISLGALSALYPAIVASRADPYDAIRSGRK
ncbi:MAG TPA: FtsX-like permease family protein, partial [Methanomassiliicoccales archaeon]|nr:FtsX-like permease family protein [Methanomassiliicoccales archaeon]